MESRAAYNKIVTDNATNDEAKYPIHLIEEGIAKDEQSKTKTSEILTALETKVEEMSE